MEKSHKLRPTSLDSREVGYAAALVSELSKDILIISYAVRKLENKIIEFTLTAATVPCEGSLLNNSVDSLIPIRYILGEYNLITAYPHITLFVIVITIVISITALPSVYTVRHTGYC